jgi:hypothetical protein
LSTYFIVHAVALVVDNLRNSNLNNFDAAC